MRARVPSAIALTYEDLCRDGFANEELDHFFGRHIALENPQGELRAVRFELWRVENVRGALSA